MTTREVAARHLVEALDDPLLKALADPTRCDLVRKLVLQGPADVATIAAGYAQDRSVISRHLRVLLDAGVARATKDGRHVYYDLDGPALLDRLDKIVSKARTLVQICCPK